MNSKGEKAAAFVSYKQWEGDDLKISNTHIRLCRPVWGADKNISEKAKSI
jgi:hypothetical protein